MTETIKQKTQTLVMRDITTRVLLSLILIAAISYIYFANTAVRTLTVLEKTKGHIQTLSIKVSELESERLALENDINPENISSLGFVEVKNPIFILKNSSKTTLSLKID